MIQPGTLLQNRYLVVEQVGQGGMGEVYLATDERFQSTVAIKRTFYQDQEMRKAFEREARLLNRLRHAALPKVSDHFGDGDDQFLVMEFIEGSDLSELLKRRKVPFPLADVLRWADELLDALDYLHTQEPPVVHRDIKPPNIKLTPRGRVVLLDFGLAKGLPSQTTSGSGPSVFGYSLHFAPLEQMQGSGTDPRSDLYSLAATLYYLLTAVRPPDALTRAAATVKLQPDPLRPAHVIQAQVPAAVGHILHRAMSQNSARRHASAAELRAALRQAANEALPREPRPQPGGSILPRQETWQETKAPIAEALDDSAWQLELEELSLPSSEDSQNSSAPRARGSRPAARQSVGRSVALSGSLNSSPAAADEVSARGDSCRPPRPSDSYTVSARRVSPPSLGTKGNRTLGLVACLLVICAAAGTYLFARASGSHVPPAGANAEAQPSAPQVQQTTPAQVSQPAAAGAPSSDSSQAAAGLSESTPSLNRSPAGEAPAPGPQAAAEATAAPAPAGLNANVGSSATDGSGVAGAPSSGRPGLVIQNPAPASTPADESRRAAEPRREQPTYSPEYAERPASGPAYPPPPGRRPPPPPDGRRPPPFHRPPPR